jgi:hypothetical protein
MAIRGTYLPPVASAEPHDKSAPIPKFRGTAGNDLGCRYYRRRVVFAVERPDELNLVLTIQEEKLITGHGQHHIKGTS